MHLIDYQSRPLIPLTVTLQTFASIILECFTKVLLAVTALSQELYEQIDHLLIQIQNVLFSHQNPSNLPANFSKLSLFFHDYFNDYLLSAITSHIRLCRKEEILASVPITLRSQLKHETYHSMEHLVSLYHHRYSKLLTHLAIPLQPYTSYEIQQMKKDLARESLCINKSLYPPIIWDLPCTQTTQNPQNLGATEGEELTREEEKKDSWFALQRELQKILIYVFSLEDDRVFFDNNNNNNDHDNNDHHNIGHNESSQTSSSHSIIKDDNSTVISHNNNHNYYNNSATSNNHDNNNNNNNCKQSLCIDDLEFMTDDNHNNNSHRPTLSSTNNNTNNISTKESSSTSSINTLSWHKQLQHTNSTTTTNNNSNNHNHNNSHPPQSLTQSGAVSTGPIVSTSTSTGVVNEQQQHYIRALSNTCLLTATSLSSYYYTRSPSSHSSYTSTSTSSNNNNHHHHHSQLQSQHSCSSFSSMTTNATTTSTHSTHSTHSTSYTLPLPRMFPTSHCTTANSGTESIPGMFRDGPDKDPSLSQHPRQYFPQILSMLQAWILLLSSRTLASGDAFLILNDLYGGEGFTFCLDSTLKYHNQNKSHCNNNNNNNNNNPVSIAMTTNGIKITVTSRYALLCQDSLLQCTPTSYLTPLMCFDCTTTSIVLLSTEIIDQLQPIVLLLLLSSSIDSTDLPNTNNHSNNHNKEKIEEEKSKNSSVKSSNKPSTMIDQALQQQRAEKLFWTLITHPQRIIHRALTIEPLLPSTNNHQNHNNKKR
jgi:hypothetical protein